MNNAEVWKCPACPAVWQSWSGKCPDCLYGFSEEEKRAMRPTMLVGANGQALEQTTRGAAGSVGQPVPARAAASAPVEERYQALLAGVQQMLQPVVQWLQGHGVVVQQLTEVLPTMLKVVEQIETRASSRNRAETPSVPPEWQTRIEHLERGLQQLALAMATLRQPEPAPLVPQTPEQPYSSFLIEDREQAQLEQALLQQQRTRPQPWE